MDANRKFLSLLGWEGEELESFLPCWLKAQALLKLTDKDVEYAVDEWLPKYWDLSLLSVRKMIAALIRETAVLAQMKDYEAQGKKLLYGNSTSSFASIYANKLAGGDELHIAYPDFTMSTALQAFFGKDEVLNNCEYMNSSCSHCALNCANVVSRVSGIVPNPTVSWSWGLHCDEAPKTVEMVTCINRLDQSVDVLTAIPHDAVSGEVEADNDYRVAFLAQQIKYGQQRVTELTGIEVTEEHLKASMEAYMAYMRKVEVLTELVVNADPQPVSGSELALFGLCMQTSMDTGLDYVNDALDTAIVEVKERIRLGQGPLPKGAPRMACHFVPLNVPWVDRAFRDNGVNLSVGRIFPLASTMEEKLKHDTDIYMAVARQCLMFPDAVNMQNEAEIISGLFSRYNFEGALFGFYDFDRWIGALHKTMIHLVEEKTGIPHYYLEGDFWGSSKYSIENRISVIRSICNCLKISSI